MSSRNDSCLIYTHHLQYAAENQQTKQMHDAIVAVNTAVLRRQNVKVVAA